MTYFPGSKVFGCFEKHPKVVSGALRGGFRAREVFGSFEKRTPGPNQAARVNVSRNAFLSSRSERKRFLKRWYCQKKTYCTLIDNEYASLLFSQTFFSYCFCMLSDFAKVFERKVWRVQVAHLHNAARALSSPSRCFQLSTNLGKDFFRYLW